jgi:hypothetical protein
MGQLARGPVSRAPILAGNGDGSAPAVAAERNFRSLADEANVCFWVSLQHCS